jgi:hypothetical protein
MKLSTVFENLILARAQEAAPASHTNPGGGPQSGLLGHLFNCDRLGATNIGRKLARLLNDRPLISAPPGHDLELMDLDAELHNN